MGISTAGVIGALVGMALAFFGYINRRDYYRQQLAQFGPTGGERQREWLRWGLERSQGWLYSSRVQLPLSMIVGAFVGYLLGRLFD